MGTTIRPKLSEKNPYWIEKHRYYELKHFCLQYPIWKKAYESLNGLSRRPADLEIFVKNNACSAIQPQNAQLRNRFILTGSR